MAFLYKPVWPVRRLAGTQANLLVVRIHFGSPLSSQVVVKTHRLATSSSTIDKKNHKNGSRGRPMLLQNHIAGEGLALGISYHFPPPISAG